METKRVYFAGTYNFSHPTRVLKVEPTPVEDGQEPDPARAVTLVLEETIFHPQGGGQPTDTGRILSEDGGAAGPQFRVAFVQNSASEPIVLHMGAFETDARFAEGDRVTLAVDEEPRLLHARLHSAGHLLDAALDSIGYGNEVLPPSKGFHFPSSPYVEYLGNVAADNRAQVLADCNQAIADLVERDLAVVVGANEEGTRTISIGAYATCACGGTHVRSTADLRGLQVTKIKKKGKGVRFSYTFVDA